MEIYIRSQLGLDELASKFRELINIANENPTKYQREQKRESQNYGGEYYLFELLQGQILLLKNAGEVLIDEMEGYQFYLVCSFPLATEEETQTLARYFSSLLAYLGFETVVDDLS